MRREHIVELGTALSRARRLGRLCSADLRSIPSMEDARRVQDAAIAHYGGQVCGYTLAASFACVFRRSRPGIPISSRPPFRREAGRHTDLKPATKAALLQVGDEDRLVVVPGQAAWSAGRCFRRLSPVSSIR